MIAGPPAHPLAAVAAVLHTGGLPASPADLWHHGWFPLTVVLPLAVGCVLYALGVRALWRSAGQGRGISRRRVAAFAAGVLVLLIALASPLDPAGEVLFSAHMVQHLLLILVAAPLLVAGAPERVTLWAFPPAGRKRIGRWGHAIRGVAGALARPGPAVAVATSFLWAWHLPALYDRAVENEALHALEHATFLLTALLFWWTLLRIRTVRAHHDNGGRLLALFAMVVQGSLLGALITFAAVPLYAAHREIPSAWGLEPLVDQQLAGLIMWVPPAALYLGVASYLFLGWMGAAEARGQRGGAHRDGAAAPEEGEDAPGVVVGGAGGVGTAAPKEGADAPGAVVGGAHTRTPASTG